MNIRLGKLEHIPEMSELILTTGLQNIHTPPESQKQTWLAWASNHERLAERILNPHNKVFISNLNDTLVGTGYVNLKNQTAYIGAIYIHPNYQQQQIGTALLKHLLKQVNPNQHNTIEAQISEENLPSQKLFQNHGFIYAGESPSDYFTPTIWQSWIKQI